jgi:ribonuclease HI
MDLWLHPEYSGRDIVTVVWNQQAFSHSQIYVTSLYCDITANMISEEFKQLVAHCTSKNLPLIVMADSNAHSTTWGSPSTNPRGAEFENFMIDYSLNTLNTGSVPTFDCNRGKTIIDISVITPEVEEFVLSWRVRPEHMCSDHKCVEIVLDLHPAFVFSRNYKKMDWDLFRQTCTQHLSQQTCPARWNLDDIEGQLDRLYKAISLATDMQAPLIKQKARVSLTWFTDDLKKEKRSLQSLHKKVLAGKKPMSTYQEARRQYNYNIRKSKTGSWKAFASDTNDLRSAANLEKLLQKSPRNSVNFIKKPDGRVAETPQESADILMAEHFPMSIPLSDSPANEDWLMTLNPPAEIPNLDWITVPKIRKTILTFGSDKAAGPDSLKPKLLKELPEEALRLLQQIFCACIALSYTPKLWRTSKTIFIPKPGKKDYCLARSFRPISLTSFLFKTLEKLVMSHIESAFTLHPNQHAFRKGRSTDSALSYTVDLIEKSVLRGQYVLGIFLDIEGAFDNLSLRSVERSLQDHDVPDPIIKWYMHYMHNRVATADLRGTSTSRLLSRGTPQGGVLSPLMWNMAFDSLLSKFDEGAVRICGFADDAALMISGIDPFTLVDRMNFALKTVAEWASNHQLCFSAMKSKAILFHTKTKPPKLPSVVINNQPIQYTDSTTYLGVLINRKLDWTQHILAKCSEVKSRLLQLRNRLGKLWGPKPYITKWIWSGILQPKLSYACHIWLGATSLKKVTSHFDRLHSLAMRLMGNFRTGTPTAGLQIALGFPPLDLVFQDIALNTLRRLNLNDLAPHSWDGLGNGSRKGHIKFLTNLHSSLNLPPIESEDSCQNTFINCKATLEEDSFKEGNDCGYDSLRIYTDDSKIGEETGCGYSMHRKRSEPEIQNASLYLGTKASVFQAEIEAISQAAQDAPNVTKQGEEISLFSDSRSAILALFKPYTNSKTVYKCVQALNNLNIRNPVTILWIKAHVGHLGNELADGHAKNGILHKEELGLTPIPSSPAYFRALTQETLKTSWNDRWFQRDDCIHSKNFYPEVDLRKSAKIVKLNREKLSRLIRFTTGHTFLSGHRKTIKPNADINTMCRLCELEKETAEHIVADCEVLWKPRSDSFYKPFLDIPIPWEVPHMSKFLQNPKVRTLETLPERSNGAHPSGMSQDD